MYTYIKLHFVLTMYCMFEEIICSSKCLQLINKWPEGFHFLVKDMFLEVINSGTPNSLINGLFKGVFSAVRNVGNSFVYDQSIATLK